MNLLLSLVFLISCLTAFGFLSWDPGSLRPLSYPYSMKGLGPPHLVAGVLPGGYRPLPGLELLFGNENARVLSASVEFALDNPVSGVDFLESPREFCLERTGPELAETTESPSSDSSRKPASRRLQRRLFSAPGYDLLVWTCLPGIAGSGLSTLAGKPTGNILLEDPLVELTASFSSTTLPWADDSPLMLANHVVYHLCRLTLHLDLIKFLNERPGQMSKDGGIVAHRLLELMDLAFLKLHEYIWNLSRTSSAAPLRPDTVLDVTHLASFANVLLQTRRLSKGHCYPVRRVLDDLREPPMHLVGGRHSVLLGLVDGIGNFLSTLSLSL